MQPSKREIVVTGVGIVTSNGNNAKEFQEAVIEGKMGIKECPIFEDFSYSTKYGGWIDDGVNDRWDGRFSRLSRISLDEAMADANLTSEEISSLGHRAELYIGSANLGSLKLEKQLRGKWSGKISPDAPLDFNTSDITFDLSSRSGTRGKICKVDAACASAKIGIGEAFRSIQQNRADLCIVGGVDVFSDLSLSGFDAMNNLDSTPCKPFDRDHNNITIGEGAAFLVLEEKKRAKNRGAKMYGRIFGYHTSNDAYHVTAPDPSGEGAAFCMTKVLEEWDNKDRILYVNAHGTGTHANDSMEVLALEVVQEKFAFDKIYFSSTKSLIGHTLGASGLIEFIASLLALEKGKMPLSISVKNPMDFNRDRLELVLSGTEYPICRAFVSNSFAFAGNSASIGYEKIGE